MWNKEEGYYSKFRYVEVARYVEANARKMVAREKSGDDPLLIEWSEVEKYRDKHQNRGLYTSLFRYNSKSMDRAIRLGSLYFDIDSAQTEEALFDARKLTSYLIQYIPESAIRIYFTGKKGFHVECEAIALGITPSNDLASIYRFIAGQLKEDLVLSTLDFAVYEPRRMWRLPNSQHQSTGLYKVIISNDELQSLDFAEIAEHAKAPREIAIPDQEFSLDANAWYRDFTYRYEAANQKRNETAESVIARFTQHGSGHITDFEREFNPVKLFEGCPAILSLWAKAETKNDLEHEERLFLCSILSYTDESIQYLHAILSNCHDYSFEKSQAHIEDWVKRREMGIGGRPYTCDRASSAGISCTGCSKLDPKPKYEKIGNKLYPTSETTSPSPIRLAYSKMGKQ